MVRWLKTVVDWLFGRHSSLIQLSLEPPKEHGLARRRRGPDLHTGPYDPDSNVREPRRRGPAGRSASTSVPEPDDADTLMAIGGAMSRRPVVNRRSSDEDLTSDGPG